jgi:hypothetical protein
MFLCKLVDFITVQIWQETSLHILGSFLTQHMAEYFQAASEETHHVPITWLKEKAFH